MAPRILILGGGFAGLYTARELRKRLGDSAQIELVSEENYFVFQPLLPEVAAGSISALHAVAPLRALLRGIRFRKARVAGIDTDAKRVTIFQGVQRRPTEIGYDHLVVALGTVTDLSRIPGLSDHALTMKSLQDARGIRAHVIERLEHADITNLPEVKREALTFTVIGAGFSGIETVGEIKELIDRALPYYPNISPDEIRVIVVEFADRVLGELPEALGRYAATHLEKRGIEIRLGTGVASATGTALTLSDGEVVGTRTIIATIGAQPPKILQTLPLTIEHGRIRTDRGLRAAGSDSVWALGDCALIPMKDGASERADFAPPTAQFAVREARAVAANIARALKNEAPEPFDYASQGALASLGARRGVAELRGRQVSGYLAWLLWRVYYLGLLPGFATKLRVAFNWAMDSLAPRSVVQIRPADPPGVRLVHFRAGDRIFEEGNRSDGVYTVIEGKVAVTRTLPEEGGQRDYEIGPGEHFGGRIIMGTTRRLGTAKALEDSKLLLIDRDAFLTLAEGLPALRYHFQAHVAETYGLNWRHEGEETEPVEKIKTRA